MAVDPRFAEGYLGKGRRRDKQEFRLRKQLGVERERGALENSFVRIRLGRGLRPVRK